MTAPSLVADLVPPAQDLPQPGDYDPGVGLFLLVMFLVVAVVVLALSFRKQLRKTKNHFAEDEPDRGDSETGSGDGPANDRES